MENFNEKSIEKLILSKKFWNINDTVTICAITVVNGCEIVGQAFSSDKSVGETLAYQNAVNRLQEMEYYKRCSVNQNNKLIDYFGSVNPRDFHINNNLYKQSLKKE